MLQLMLKFCQKFQFYIICPVIENVVQNQTSGGFFAFAKNRCLPLAPNLPPPPRLNPVDDQFTVQV